MCAVSSGALIIQNIICVITTGRQSRQTEQHSSAPSSRCKTPERANSSTFRGARPFPIFPLDPSSTPTSPTKDNREQESSNLGENRRWNHASPGCRSGAAIVGGKGKTTQSWGSNGGKGLLSESQVRLLVGLHYLPHEHGFAAQKLLQDLTWLKSNCHLVSANSKKSAPQKVSICICVDI